LLNSRRASFYDSEDPGAVCLSSALSRGEHVVLRLRRGQAVPSGVRQLLADAKPSAMVLSGGDTASLVCHPMEVGCIELRREIADGIPAGVVFGGLFDQLPVVTKSGGFGRTDDLIKVADFFHA